ncbi:MAG: hypothetical protein IT210_23150, partial [Armatimonadetes bacterium]|nr:hypothetical protein [Armatimonadota bacterium]
VGGTSGEKVGYRGEAQALYEQAINHAALNLSQEIATALTSSGVILMVRDNKARINLGKQDNIHVGAEIAVMHGEEEVAILVVTEVDTAQSEAKISSGDIKQVYTNDKIRVKYNPPTPVKTVKKSNNGMAVLGLLLLAALVGAAGGKGGGGGDAAPPPGGGSSSTYRIEPLPSTLSVAADGKSTVTIDVTVKDTSNHLAKDGTVVKFDTTLGSIPAQAATVAGKVQAVLTSGTTAGTAVVKVSVDKDYQTFNVQFVGSGAYVLQMLPSSTSIVADGKSAAIIDITVTDSENHLVSDGTVVKFDTTLGSIPAQGTTSGGKVQAVLTSGATPGTATFKATVGNISQTLAIQFVPVTPPGQPATIRIEPSAPSVLADGKSTVLINVTVEDSLSRPVPDGTLVKLGTTLGSIVPAQATTIDGKVQAVLTSGTASGVASITVTAGSVNKLAEIQFSAATPAVIEMAASPQQIQVERTGGTELATIRATVKDVKGNSIATQTTVAFSILGAPNGASLTRLEVGTQDGVATTELKSGKVAGTIRVKAEVKGNSTVTAAQTSVVIHAGPPYYLDFGLLPLNIAGLVYVNETSDLTGYVSDVYKNPVPDGTTVYFTTAFGMINASATTAGGIFKTVVHSGDPLPRNDFAFPDLAHPEKSLVPITASTRKENGVELKKTQMMLWSGPTAPIKILGNFTSFDLGNGESTSFMAEVSDIFGNSIVAGSTISVTGSGVAVSGDVNVVVADTAVPGQKIILNIALSDPNEQQVKATAATVIIRVKSRNGDTSIGIPGATE